MSDTGVVLLNEALLDELESRWREQGAPVVDYLRPGLADAEMDELTERIGLRLPAEARRWWGWHDGAPMAPPYAHGAWQIGPGTEFRSLAQCVADCERWREERLGRSKWWRFGWLPTYGVTQDAVVFDCGVGFGDPVPVYAYFLVEEDMEQPDVRSLGELVTSWIKLIDCGAWWFDRAEDRWDADLTKLPADGYLPGLW